MNKSFKTVVRKIFPGTYLSLARVKKEVFEEYKECKKNNDCQISFLGYLYNYIVYGATPQEFNILGFKDLNKSGKHKFITMRKNRSLDRKYNDTEANKILWEKDKFNEYFSEFISRKWIYITSSTSDESIQKFYNSLEGGKFIIKPSDMYYGLGIRIGLNLSDIQSAKYNIQGGVIVEQVIKNETSLAQLNPTSLNTLRVVTCVDSNGNAYVVTVILRTGNKGAVIDNARGGGSFYHVDLESGLVDMKGRDSLGNSYVFHPSSGIKMVGFKIPRFDELKEYSKRLALKLKQCRYVGWDIAITDDGFEVIEGNVCPSAELIQCDRIGLLPKLNLLWNN